MVPPTRSTPSLKPPAPLAYCQNARALMIRAATTRPAHRAIFQVNGLMAGLNAFPRTRERRPPCRPTLADSLSLRFGLFLRLGRLFFAGDVADDAALDHPQPGVVVDPDGDLVLRLADGDDRAVDAGGGEDLVVLLQVA